MIQLPFTNDLILQLNNSFLRSLTQDNTANIYRIISYDSMYLQLKSLCSASNLFYMMNIITSQEVFKKGLEIGQLIKEQKEIDINKEYATYQMQIEEEIKAQRYHKQIYHQIMLIDDKQDPFDKLSQAIVLLYENNKKHIGKDLEFYLNNQYIIWYNIFSYVRSILMYYYNTIVYMDDSEIINKLDDINNSEFGEIT